MEEVMEDVLEPGREDDAEVVSVDKAGAKRIAMRGALLLALVGALTAGARSWLAGQLLVETDNAFVEGHQFAVAARVPGTVSRVLVNDNQFVHKGDLLATLDDRDFAVRLSNARAEMDISKNDTAGDRAQVEMAAAELERSRAELSQADLDLRRAEALVEREVMPREQLDRRRTGERVAAARVKESQERLKKAQAALGLVAGGRVGAREAKRQTEFEEQRLNLSYTKLYAPADGFVTRKSVEPGNRVQPGQPLLAIVPLDDAWVTANYKESQLTRVFPGQKVTFSVDAYPGREFSGTVESIMAGTGAAFSLLPPENATGNYVKVVQRVPVKIAIDRASDPGQKLRVGMSVTPSIHLPRTAAEIVKELLHLS